MKTSKSKTIQTVIALLIMFVAGYFIPTWGPVTRMGVQYLCIMIGWIYMSIVTVVIIVCILSCVITQFFSNSATAILFLTALAPLAVVLYQEGVNVSVFPALIGTGTLTACLLPSGSGQSAIMLSTDIFADDGQQWALSKGIIVLVGITLAIVAAGVISILVL